MDGSHYTSVACLALSLLVFVFVLLQQTNGSEIEHHQLTDHLNELENSIDGLKVELRNFNSSIEVINLTSDEAELKLDQLMGNMYEVHSSLTKLKDTVHRFKSSLVDLKEIFERYRHDQIEKKRREGVVKDRLPDNNDEVSSLPQDTKGVPEHTPLNNDESEYTDHDFKDLTSIEKNCSSVYKEDPSSGELEDEQLPRSLSLTFPDESADEESGKGSLIIEYNFRSPRSVTWIEAEKKCQEMNASLAVIDSTKRREQIVSMMKRLDWSSDRFWMSKRSQTVEATPSSDEPSDTRSQKNELCPFFDFNGIGESLCCAKKNFACEIRSSLNIQ